METLRRNDSGTTIILTLKEAGVVVDISSASPKRIEIRKPSGAVVQRTGSFITNGTDGKLYCQVTSGDLAELGIYRAAMRLTIGSWSGHSSSLLFKVEETP